MQSCRGAVFVRCCASGATVARRRRLRRGSNGHRRWRQTHPSHPAITIACRRLHRRVRFDYSYLRVTQAGSSLAVPRVRLGMLP